MDSRILTPQFQALTIVVVGRFNPAIFHPLWFSKTEMFSESEINDASDTLGIVHPDIADFQLDWCKVHVTENRFTVTTRMDAYFTRLNELVQLSFGLLSHTPVIALGINPEADFSMGNEEKWHKFGHTYAPKEIWKEITNNPGMQELIIKDMPREGEFEGYTNYTLRPSARNDIQYGVYIQMNEHFELGKPDYVEGTDKLLNILESQFENTLEKWEKVYKHLINSIE